VSGTKYGVQSVELNCTAWVRGLGVGMKNGKWEVWSVERGAWSRDWGVRNANGKEKNNLPKSNTARAAPTNWHANNQCNIAPIAALPVRKNTRRADWR
jgi:hypothetical protein